MKESLNSFQNVCAVGELKENMSVAYSSKGNHMGLLDFRNWLADGYTRDYMINITFSKV